MKQKPCKTSSYGDLLRDPRWQKKRLEILGAANWTCESCESKEKTLHVHHRYYEYGKRPWEYPDDAYQCFCENCHESAGNTDAQIKFGLRQLDYNERDLVLGYIKGLLFQHGPCDPVLVENYEVAAGIAASYEIHPDLVIDIASNNHHYVSHDQLLRVRRLFGRL